MYSAEDGVVILIWELKFIVIVKSNKVLKRFKFLSLNLFYTSPSIAPLHWQIQRWSLFHSFPRNRGSAIKVSLLFYLWTWFVKWLISKFCYLFPDLLSMSSFWRSKRLLLESFSDWVNLVLTWRFCVWISEDGNHVMTLRALQSKTMFAI